MESAVLTVLRRVARNTDRVGIPVNALVLDEQHLSESAAQLEGADDPIVHQRPDPAMLPRVHHHGRVEQPLLLFARDPPIANGLRLLVQPNTEPMERRLVDKGWCFVLGPIGSPQALRCILESRLCVQSSMLGSHR